MGIGRREFLQLFGGALATLAGSRSSAIAILDDQYINRKLGIAFRKPVGWTFADVKEMGEIKAGQILDLDDANLSRELIDSADLPIVAISKDGLSSSSNRFTPGVMIYLDRFDWADAFEGNFQVPPLENAIADIDSCQSMLKDFCVTSPPKPMAVSNCDAAEYRASFIFEHVNMRPTRVRMQTLAIYQRPAFYTLRMYDSVDELDCIFDFSSFVKSVRML